ncbi:hypothetical protein Hanom_Chr16g01463471 [Helianthus anomalus]
MFCRGLSLSMVKELIRSQVQVLLLTLFFFFFFFFFLWLNIVLLHFIHGLGVPTQRNDRFTQCFFSPVGYFGKHKMLKSLMVQPHLFSKSCRR